MANQSELKQENVLRILKAIRKQGTASKPEIAKATDLTSVTAHNFINHLVEQEIVVETGYAKSHGGRKAVLYSMNPDYGYLMGVNLGRNIITICIYNINLELLYSDRIDYQQDYPDKIITMIVDEIDKAKTVTKLSTKDFLGIGITIPGQVTHDTGTIINITEMPSWNGITLKEIIENSTGIPCFVDNDNNAAAMAIKWNNPSFENADLVCITVGDGVGTGILIDGKLFYGSHSNSGEFGHTTIDYDGPVCKCGNRGCIEALISDYAIINNVKQAGFNDVSNIQEVVDLAKSGNQIIMDILSEKGRLTGIAVEHIVKILDPDVIVIINSWINEFPEMQYFIRDSVFFRCPLAKKNVLKILFNKIENLENIGPSALVLEKCFQLSYADLLLQRAM